MGSDFHIHDGTDPRNGIREMSAWQQTGDSRSSEFLPAAQRNLSVK